MLNEAGVPPAVGVALIEQQLYRAICGMTHLFCYIKLILLLFNEATIQLMFREPHYILPTLNIFLQKQSNSVDMLKALAH